MMYKAAAEATTAGVQADNEGQYARAIKYYKLALNQIDEIVKTTSSVEGHAQLRQRSELLRQRIRDLSAASKGGAGPVVRSEPSSSATPASAPKKGDDEKCYSHCPTASSSSTAGVNTDRTNSFRCQLEEMFDRPIPKLTLDDVIGLEEAKAAIQESIVFPLRFRSLIPTSLGWNAVLLYGPPGTGKTMLAMSIANAFNASFLAISSADIMSQWQGESEKQLRRVFEAAMERAPCVIFIDEVDSLCTRRSDRENDSTRRVKTEFLVQMSQLDRAPPEKLVLVLAATNVPWDLDPAGIRRFQKRIYVGLPDQGARVCLFKKELSRMSCMLSCEDYEELGRLSEGFSASDISVMCRDALMEPFRAIYKATHFKTIITEEGSQKFYPLPRHLGCPWWGHCTCSSEEIDKAAIPLTHQILDPNDMLIPLIQWTDVFHALQRANKTVKPEDILKYKNWAPNNN